MWAVRLQSVRPVGPTGLTDQSDVARSGRPVGPTIGTCKRFIRLVGPTIVPCKRPVSVATPAEHYTYMQYLLYYRYVNHSRLCARSFAYWAFTRYDRRTDRSVRLVGLTSRMKRLHVPIVCPTGRTKRLHDTIVGPTSRTDRSDRPVGPKIVPCKRPVTNHAFPGRPAGRQSSPSRRC